MFERELEDTMEPYIDDMVIKSKVETNYLAHLTKVFDILRAYKLRLNVENVSLDSAPVMHHGIAQLPDIKKLVPPHNKRDVQRLTRMAIALDCSISRSSDKCQPFFNLLKGNLRSFNWTEECDQAQA